MRRIRELAAGGRASLPAITANISQVEGVEFAKTWGNTSLVTDSDGIEGKAVNVVVDLDPDTEDVRQAVADEIFSTVAGGILSHGTDVTKTVTDSQGVGHEIKYDLVGLVTIWVKVTLTTSTSEETYPTTGDDAVKAADPDPRTLC